jgi:L-fucose isomerase-like protein
MTNHSVQAAFVGFGEVNSPQELIAEKCRQAGEELLSLGFNLVLTDHVTDDPEGRDVSRALKDLSKHSFDVLIICIAGWIPSYPVIAITEEYKHKPMILWGLSGDFRNGQFVTAAPQAGTTALRLVFENLGYKFRYVYCMIGKPSPLDRIKNFALASAAVNSMQHTRIGMMGFRDMNLYNTLYDGQSLKRMLGTEVCFFEMLDMVERSKSVEIQDIQSVLLKVSSEWDFVKPVDEEFLKKGIRYYLAIRKIAEQSGFTAISLKDVDGMKRLLHFPPAMIFMLLSDEARLCTIPENDVMGAVTQLIIKKLTGQCAVYLEFYEFFEKSILLGVPDYVPAEVVEGRTKVMPAAFGDISGGLLNVSTLKTGQLTLARLSSSGDQYTMHICTGEGRLISWEEAGWTQPAPQLPSLEVFLDSPVEEFAQNVSGQHYIIAYGDHSGSIKDFCYLKNIRVI